LAIFNARRDPAPSILRAGVDALSNQTKGRPSENSSPRYVEKVPFVTGNHQK